MRWLAVILLAAATEAAVADDGVWLPYEWLEMCHRDGGCEAAVVTAEDVAWINAQINRSITPYDEPGADSWRAFPAGRRGDCDDYVATKRAALIALGVPAGSLAIVAGEAAYPDGRNLDHAVLEVTIGGRTYVLDNLAGDAIYPPGRAPYPWRTLARQTPGAVLWQTNDDQPQGDHP